MRRRPRRAPRSPRRSRRPRDLRSAVQLTLAMLAGGLVILALGWEWAFPREAALASLVSGAAAVLVAGPVMAAAWRSLKSPSLHGVTDLLVALAMTAAFASRRSDDGGARPDRDDFRSCPRGAQPDRLARGDPRPRAAHANDGEAPSRRRGRDRRGSRARSRETGSNCAPATVRRRTGSCAWAQPPSTQPRSPARARRRRQARARPSWPARSISTGAWRSRSRASVMRRRLGASSR